MSAKSINENCRVNTVKKMRKNWMPFTKNSPGQDYNGNERHFFAEALGQIYEDPTAMNNMKILLEEDQKKIMQKKQVIR